MTVAGAFPKIDTNVYYSEDANLSANIITVEAGENITAGKVVYFHLTSGTAFVSDTGTTDDIRANGIALDTATTGSDIQVQTYGEYLTTGLTDKGDYYLGAAGVLSEALSGVRIGTALSTTQLFINIIQDDRGMVGTMKSYSPNISGIPSNNLTAFWQLMDGTTISDSESPLDGQTIADVNGEDRYLKGTDTSDATAGSTTTGTNNTFHNTTAGGVGASQNGETHQVNPKHYTTVFIIKKK